MSANDEQTKDRPKNAADVYLDAKRSELLISNIRPALISSAINSFIVGGVFFFWLGVEEARLWFSLSLATNAIRALVTLNIARSQTSFQSAQWHLVTALTGFAGVLWALPVFMVPAGSDPVYENVAVMVVAGMCAGASHSYAARPRLSVVFILPALLLLGLYYCQTTGPVKFAAVALLTMYFIGLLSVTRGSRAAFEQAIWNEWHAEQQRFELDDNREVLRRQVAATKASETVQKQQVEKLRSLNLALDQLFSKHLLEIGSSDALIRDCTQVVSEQLRVGRVSVWFLNDAQTALVSHSAYRLGSGRYDDADITLHQDDYPIYFGNLRENRIIIAPDVATNPQTQEFAGSYIEENDIRSFMDAPIQHHGGVSGVICCESVGETRDWQADEIGFVTAVAQLISIRLLIAASEELNGELKQALEAAQAADRAKADFMATMNHELRTPMNGVLGAASILAQSGLDDESGRLANAIVQSGGTLMALLNDMLDFSKFEAGRVDLEEIDFRIDHILHEVREIHVHTANEKGVALDVRGYGIDGRTLVGDPHRLKQILHNLVSNAIKFTAAGSVTLDARFNEATGLQLTVRDTGIGIAADRLETIFEPFLQADTSITRQFGGTGLGLAIVDKLVRAMNGQLKIKSKLGKGTCVAISVPLAASAASPPRVPDETPPSAAPEKEPLAGLSVLAVDDNTTNILVLRAFLERVGADVVTAKDGQTALEAFGVGNFDAVLMDIHMPGMGGVEAMQRIRAEFGARGGSTPVIAVTADTMPEQVAAYRTQGFDDYIGKPVRLQDLLKVLSQYKPENSESVPTVTPVTAGASALR